MTLLSHPARTLRTVRHLRPSQLAHRIRYLLRRARWERASETVDRRYRQRAASLPEMRWQHEGLERVAAFRLGERDDADALAVARDALEGRFSFLGRREDLGNEVDWTRSDLDRGTRLWKTLLHEFPFALDLARAATLTGEAVYRERLLALARGWRASSPIGCRDFALDAWNARAVANRLVSWALAGNVLGLEADAADAAWLGREIGLHGLFLRDNLELDLGGNHLFRDAVGLVFAETLVGGIPDALAWLERVLSEQILADGCHVERAPFYHAACTRDLFEVSLLLGDATPGWLRDGLARMAGFLDAIALGDGEIPLLGDAWLGEVDVPHLLRAVRARVDPAPPRAPERHSGLAALRAGPWRAVVRVGRHAPDEQMGHAHADLLSFDASCGTRRIVTDTGTLLYDSGPDRQRLRGTAAHNTIRIDGAEQIEAWGSFRVGRRGRARATSRGRTGSWEWVSASHDAFRWLPGDPVPHRLVALGPDGVLVVDALLGRGRHRIESHLHEHPSAAGEDVRMIPLAGRAERVDALLHERFGETRSMIRHRVVSDETLPWVGGWWIAPTARAGDVGGAALVGNAPEIEVVLGPGQVRLRWRPRATDAEEAVVLCSASGQSAT